jgi:hypothetical protein
MDFDVAGARDGLIGLGRERERVAKSQIGRNTAADESSELMARKKSLHNFFGHCWHVPLAENEVEVEEIISL